MRGFSASLAFPRQRLDQPSTLLLPALIADRTLLPSKLRCLEPQVGFVGRRTSGGFSTESTSACSRARGVGVIHVLAARLLRLDDDDAFGGDAMVAQRQ